MCPNMFVHIRVCVCVRALSMSERTETKYFCRYIFYDIKMSRMDVRWYKIG